MRNEVQLIAAHESQFNGNLRETSILRRPRLQPPGFPEGRIPILNFRDSMNALINSSGLSRGQKILAASTLTFAEVKNFESDPSKPPSVGTSSEFHKGFYASDTINPFFAEIAPYVRSLFTAEKIPFVLAPDTSSNLPAAGFADALSGHFLGEPYIMRAKKGGSHNPSYTQVQVEAYTKGGIDTFHVEEDSLPNAMIKLEKSEFGGILKDDYLDTGSLATAMEQLMQALRQKGYSIEIIAVVALFSKGWPGAEELLADIYGSDFPIYIGCTFDNLWTPQKGQTAGGAEIRGVPGRGLTFAGNLDEKKHGAYMLQQLQKS